MKRKEPHSTNNNIERMECELLENPRKIIRADPVQKEQKYDRQLRLWGNDGQTALEAANICLINATVVGTETLKCLVLPGIAKYAVIDDKVVKAADLNNNFFIDTSSIGKPRAQVTCKILQELNPDSSGTWVKDDAADLLENDPEFFSNFTAVICSRVGENDLLKLSNYFWQRNIPLFIVDSVGFFGYIRVVVKEHVIIKSHPDNTLEDLRLENPFPELTEYFDSMVLTEMDKLEHSHTPYLVILYKALKLWQRQSSKSFPSNYKEKLQIKEIVKSLNLKNEDGVALLEENFEEALSNANMVFSKFDISSDVKSILQDETSNHPMKSEANTKFWILVRSLKEFVNQNQCLPLRGSLPDMFSDSKRYINLQNVYKEKAEENIREVSKDVSKSLDALQLPSNFISSEEIRSFCRNAAFLKVQRGFTYHDEVRQSLTAHKIKETLKQNQGNASDIYLAFRALHLSLNDKNFNGEHTVNSLNDIIESTILKTCCLEDLKFSQDVLSEMVRFNLTEIHCVSAVMGGICAQEVIKVITRQFIPVDNTLVYNNVHHSTTSMKL